MNTLNWFGTCMLVCCAGALCLTVGVGAEELSVEQAVQIGLERSHRIEAARQGVAIAEGAVTAARSDLYPSLSAAVTQQSYDGVLFFDRFVNPLAPGQLNPNAVGTDVGEFSSSTVALLRLKQVLYAGGGIRSQVRAHQASQQVAEQQLRQQRIDLSHEIRSAYYAALLAQHSVAVRRTSVERSAATLAAIQTRRAVDEALEVEALAAESRLAYDRQRLLESENDVRLAGLQLGRLLAREGGDALQLTDDLEGEAWAVEEDSAIAESLACSPQIAQSGHEIAAAESLQQAARSYFKPKLELEAFFVSVDDETLFDGEYFGATLNIAIPFGRDIAAGRGAALQAEAKGLLERSALQEVTAGITLAVQDGVRRLVEAYGAIEVANHALAYQREHHRVTGVAFEEKLATSDDMLDASAELADAELRVHAARYQARVREADLMRITCREQG